MFWFCRRQVVLLGLKLQLDDLVFKINYCGLNKLNIRLQVLISSNQLVSRVVPGQAELLTQ